MKTRQDYLNKQCSHSEYYAQFVTPSILGAVRSRFGDRLFNSKDPNLNYIPLKEWDGLDYAVKATFVGSRMKEAGDYLTPAGIVCILKEAARQIIEANTVNA